jgi:hypothetical protein
MPLVQIYLASGGRLLPLAGGPAIIPPDAGGGGGGGPVGDVTTMLVGAASANLSGSDFADLDAAAGPFTCRRSYDSALPATFAASVAGMDVGQRASIWSCKPDLTALADGDLDGQIRAFVASIPTTHVAWLTCWHEPDHKIRSSDFPGFTLAAYLPAFRRWCQVVKDAAEEFGRPHVYTTQIVEAWSGQTPQAGTTLADMWPGNGTDGLPLVDCYGVDGYSNTGTGAALWGPSVDFAKSKGVPWGIAEIGCGTAIDTSWMAAQAAYAATHAAGGRHTKAAYFCWFSNATGGVIPTPGTDSAMLAAAHTISQTYWADFNSFVL